MCPWKSRSNACKSNITWCLLRRQQCRLSYEQQHTILQYGVCQTTRTRRTVSCKILGSPVHTCFLAFSPDGETVASSHKKFVQISEVKSGCCLHILRDHPRSVWCVVFHPSNPHLLASSCIGGVVNIWDLTKGDGKLIGALSCQNVTALALHPTHMVLLIAAGNQLLFWSWRQKEPFRMAESASGYEKIRLVRFDSLGHHILTGIRNYMSDDEEDEICSQVEENPLISQTVVHINMQNMETTVDDVTEEVITESGTRCIPISSRDMSLFRLQWWDFTHLEIPNLKQTNMHVVARNCLLSNNTSADISSDGRRLSALVMKLDSTKLYKTKICVFSLENCTFGDCLYSTTFESDIFSTCFSPLGTHIIVGMDDNTLQGDRTVAYIFKLCKKTNSQAEVTTLKVRTSDERQFSNLRASAVVWHPIIGYGLIAFGTSKGGVYFCHV
ncbi:activating molecule in BECN1-regulated autophagy 1-like [Paramuricea clavata]|uniref:Activating molecule in BECN1-regulated autophagy 1-like n=1 Tax=Paramuricea clavata TaxID=317549 RepID=A0A6S7HQQ6_PARCT|nr:activating molecule in BECN1-regulated autophagy 1-like [Paramuricea clavata]